MSVSPRCTLLPRTRAAKERPAPELAVELVFGPLAAGLVAVLKPLRVPPPAVALAGAATGLLGALALAAGAFPAAALLLQLKTLLDNADGRLARATGRAGLLGRYLDTELDLAVNAAVFAALARATGEPWLCFAGFLALTGLLSVLYNLGELHREAQGRAAAPPPGAGSRAERALKRLYGLLFAPQDRLVRRAVEGRLQRIVRDAPPERRRAALLAYHDRATLALLANLGLSTQLALFGAVLLLGLPSLYPWLVLGAAALLPLLQARRERLARRALRRGTPPSERVVS